MVDFVIKTNEIFSAGLNVNLTPISAMGTSDFARKMTGGCELDDDQKRQIREQQEVNNNMWKF